MAKEITVVKKSDSRNKKTRQGSSVNTKWGNKGSKRYKKPYRGQGK